MRAAALAALPFLAWAVNAGGGEPEAESLPGGLTRVLERGRLVSVDEPELVPASEARIPDEEWVFGVEIEGVAHAYDFNLLSRHEVVNDRFGNLPVAAVWCPLANAAAVYARTYGDDVLRFEPSGALEGASLVMRDKETDSWWSLMQGKAILGKLQGSELVQLPHGEKMPWKEWLRRHPDTLVLSVDGRTHEPENEYAEYLADPSGTYGDLGVEDERLPAKEPIFAFRTEDGTTFAVPHSTVEAGVTFTTGDPIEDDTRVFLFRDKGAPLMSSTRGWRFPKNYLGTIFASPRSLIERIEGVLQAGMGEEEGVFVIRGFDTFWYNWAPVNPDTRIIQQL